jgi:hypothetical protein
MLLCCGAVGRVALYKRVAGRSGVVRAADAGGRLTADAKNAPEEKREEANNPDEAAF